MEKIINEGFLRKYMKEDLYKSLEKEVKNILKKNGYNVKADGANKVIKTFAESIQQSRECGNDLLIEDWLRLTEENSPDDLNFMKDDIEIDNTELDIPEEAIKKEIFHNDNGIDYTVVERSKSRQNALLNKGNKWIIAWNCPEDSGSWGQGHYFFDEESARKVWQDKYLNESLNEARQPKYYQTLFGEKVRKDFDSGKLTLDNINEWEIEYNNGIKPYPPFNTRDIINYYVKTKPKDSIMVADWEATDDVDSIDIDEALSENDVFDLQSDIYNALADIMFKYHTKGVEEKDLDSALAWFDAHFWDSDDENDLENKEDDLVVADWEDDDKFQESLNEAGMSDEDRHDSEMLRNIYKKIDGKRVSKNTFTPEEQAILDKYGIDVWGYRGDTKVVTDKGRKDIINPNELGRSLNYKNNPFNKINYADRARKIDDRDYAQKVNSRRGWGKSFDDAERELQQQNQSKNINSMKSALRSRKYHQDQLDTLDSTLEKNLNNINKRYIADLEKAKKSTDYIKDSSMRNINSAQNSIDKILDKHRVKECLDKLNEASMSDEDRHDSDILRGIYKKIQARSNAKLTPEEQAVVDKYDLKRTERNLAGKDYNNYLFNDSDEREDYPIRYKHKQSGPKINYADKARKLDQRDYAKGVNRVSNWDAKKFQDKENVLLNRELGKDVYDMKSALHDRKAWKKNYDDADKAYNDKLASIQKDEEDKVQSAYHGAVKNKEYHTKELDKAKSNINKLLKRESLNEDVEKRIVETGLSGSKNKEILHSVIGQMSDGIWENSPGMDGYWMPVNISDNCNIEIENSPYANSNDWKNRTKNRYYDMTDAEVRKFFANKIKQITERYLHDNNLNPYKGWKSGSEEICTYLDRGSGVTINDAYDAYKALKGNNLEEAYVTDIVAEILSGFMPMPRRGFKYLSSNGNSGEVNFRGTNYTYRKMNDGSYRVMRSSDAGWNWSETLYKDEGLGEDFDANNLSKRGTNECEANSNRKRHIDMYRKFANLSEDEEITEENINEFALDRTACYTNREPARIRSEILGKRFSDYEV